ncbi:MAG: patatin-like phospholipase family protein [Paracoccaceae bacterium]
MTIKSNNQFDNLINKILRKNKEAKLSKRSLQTLLKTGKILSIEKDYKLFNQGDPTESVYITITGSFSVFITDDTSLASIATIGVGEFIGEMGSITGLSRSATVIANRKSKVVQLKLDTIKNSSEKNSPFLLLLAKVAIARLLYSQNGKTMEHLPAVYCLLGPNAEEVTLAISGYMKKFGSVDIFNDIEVDNKTINTREISQEDVDFTIYYSENIFDQPSESIKWMIQNSDRSILIYNGEEIREQRELIFKKFESYLSNYDTIIKWPNSKIIPGVTSWLLDSANINNHYHYIDSSDLKRISRILTGNGRALVLSGGGAKGLAHLGFYQFALENKFEFDLIVGTSSGGLIGAGIALGWSFDEMVEKMSLMAKIKPLLNLHIPKISIFKDKWLKRYCSEWFSDLTIEDTRIPYRNISVDVKYSKESVNNRGRIEATVRATAALPGVFPPVKIGETLHVDGGVMNNLPTDQTRGIGVSKIIGIDVGTNAPSTTSSAQKQSNPGLLNLITLAATLGNSATADLHRNQCDLLLLPEVSGIKIFDFKSYKEAISIGYNCAKKNKEKLFEIFYLN